MLHKKSLFWANFALLILVTVFLTLLNSLFAPTSQNQISKVFRFLEFLGKRNCRKIWKLLLLKGVKWPDLKKILDFFLIFSLCLGQLFKIFSAKLVNFSAKFGFLDVQVKANFQNFIFIACKWCKTCKYYVNSMVISWITYQKEEKEWIWLK